MRVAMLGQRGLPATFGGIERHVQELSERLVARGVEVTVFGRQSYNTVPPGLYRGINLRESRGISTKHLDALSHTATAAFESLQSDFDIIHFHGLGPGVFASAAAFSRAKRVVTTVHGMDHRRTKWGPLARRAFRLGAQVSMRGADEIIAVSSSVATDLLDEFSVGAVVIPNGVSSPVGPNWPRPFPRSADSRQRMILAVGRLVPEKGHLDLIRAFSLLVDPSLRLIIAGGASNADRYERELRVAASKDSRVTLAGYRYGSDLEKLYLAASLFVQPSYVEGMPLTLLEAMARGLPVVASDIGVHREILGNFAGGRGLASVGDLERLASEMADMLGDVSAADKAASYRQRVLTEMSWDRTAELTLGVYDRVAGRKRSRFRSRAAYSVVVG